MKAIQANAALSLPMIALALACAPSARGEEREPHKLGEHPALVVQRLHKTAGYDYASKFYPHPAWLYLYAEAPCDKGSQASIAGPVARQGRSRLLGAALEQQ